MKIAILSDSHDNVPNIEKALKYINEQGIETIIHCGDLCAPSILIQVLEPNFKGKIYLVHGNVGDPELLEEVAKKYKNVEMCGDIGKIELDGKKIAFTHFPSVGRELAETGKYDLVFYGHTHKPWEEKLKIENCKLKIVKLVNPGTLAGMFYKASFAIYDTKKDKLELKILERI